MSKPDPTTDVEDVVTSIRRLVSDRATGENSANRLVLSPQQRVAGGDVLRLNMSDAVVVPNRGTAAKPAPQDAASSPKLDDFSATIEALETEIAQTADQWEPDGVGRDDYAGTTPPGMDWPVGPDLDATGTPLTPPEEPEDDGYFLDEAALREMVVEIIREELRGTLGTRITTDLRKVVRHEIKRVLADRAGD
ncbi:hypothetical protein [Roseobacter sp.]|uniref:hypothetical protein n=1 Tax=Roseobacter sp. TaxID=1907202 RepID=UPI003299D067